MKNMDVRKELFIIGLFIIIFMILIGFIMPKDIYFTNIESIKKVALNSKYEKENLYACYGNKFFTNYSHCEDVSDQIKTVGEVNTNKEGEYILIYSINYRGIQKTINQTVKVVFDMEPVIDLMGNNYVTKCPNGNYYEPLFQATDEKDGDITDKVVKYVENDEMIYSVSDSSGNITKISRGISYIDNIKPDFSLLGDQEIKLELAKKFEDPGFKVTDNCDGNMDDKVTINSDVNSEVEGIYLVEYNVTDLSNNSFYIYRKVTVGNPILPHQDKVIYLTYDDGPNKNTESLLNILNKYNIKATFFISGQYRDFHYLIQREFIDGHTIGLHTYSHVFNNIYRSVDNFFNDLDQINNVLINQVGSGTKIMRFAGGSSNNKSNSGMMRKIIDQVKARGYAYFDWNVDSEDTKYNNPSEIARSTINQLNANKEFFIVLQHDTKAATAEATEQIIRYGIKNGYKFDSLKIDSPTIRHKQ